MEDKRIVLCNSTDCMNKISCFVHIDKPRMVLVKTEIIAIDMGNCCADFERRIRDYN